MTLTLVTGASGFVGSFLMGELLRQGIPTRGVSRSPKEGLITIPTYGPELDWRPILFGVDTIIHLAARVHVMTGRTVDPLTEFRKANVDPTIHLAQAALRAGVRRFVFVSTIKVNGESTLPGRPFKADDPPNPQGPYARSKAEAEAALLEIGRNGNLEIVIIRPPLVYGPGAKGNIATLARLGRFHPPSPFAEVDNKRSLVHVSNLCSAIISACRYENPKNDIFLISDGNSLSTHELLLNFGWKPPSRLFAPMISWITLRSLSYRKSTKQKLLCNLEVDIEKSRSALAWSPTHVTSDNILS